MFSWTPNGMFQPPCSYSRFPSQYLQKRNVYQQELAGSCKEAQILCLWCQWKLVTSSNGEGVGKTDTEKSVQIQFKMLAKDRADFALKKDRQSLPWGIYSAGTSGSLRMTDVTKRGLRPVSLESRKGRYSAMLKNVCTPIILGVGQQLRKEIFNNSAQEFYMWIIWSAVVRQLPFCYCIRLNSKYLCHCFRQLV